MKKSCFTEGEDSPLLSSNDGGFQKVDKKAELKQIENVRKWKDQRNNRKVKVLLSKLSEVAKSGQNIMQTSIDCAHAGVTTGEWGSVMRDVFGEYRAPTGIVASSVSHNKTEIKKLQSLRERLKVLTEKVGKRPKMLVGKPGLDGHSNGAEQIAVRARDVGFEVVYDGIRSSPEQLVNTCIEEGINIVGLSILSGSHLFLVDEFLRMLKRVKYHHIPIVVGGIIPPSDEKKLLSKGVSAVFTPKNFQIFDIMDDIVSIVEKKFEKFN